MPRIFHSTPVRLVAGLAAVLAIAGCSDDDDGETVIVEREVPVGNPGAVIITDTGVDYSADEVTLSETTGRTQVASYIVNIPGNGGYDLLPLLTVGDEVPLLVGTWPNYAPHDTATFSVTGIPDGMGITHSDGYYWVWVQHELNTSDATDFSRTITGGDGTLPGARTSLFKFTEDWVCVGGKNLTDVAKSETFMEGIEISLDITAGTVSQGAPAGYDQHDFARFCSGYLAETGFVDADGNEVPVWFASEENGTLSFGGDGSLAWACFPDGTAEAIDGFGAFSREQVYAASQYRSVNSDMTVMFSTEDNRDGEVYMWVGQQTADDPNGFHNGDLYVMALEDGSGHVMDANTLSVGDSVTLKWNLVPSSVALATSYTTTTDHYRIVSAAGEVLTGSVAAQAALDTWVDAEGEDRRAVDAMDASNSPQLYGMNSTNFDRPEDLHEDPNTPGTFYFAATEGETGGTAGTALTSNSDSPSVLYKFALDSADPTADTTLSVVAQGGGVEADGTLRGSGVAGYGISYDNLVVDTYGKIILQEDASGGWASPVMGGENRFATIVAVDSTDTDDFTPLFEADVLTSETSLDSGAFDGSGNLNPGVWETSGIVEVPSMNGFGRSALLLNVQAHRMRDPAILGGEYKEGGQVIIAVPAAIEVPSAIARRQRNAKPTSVGEVLGLTTEKMQWASEKILAQQGK